MGRSRSKMALRMIIFGCLAIFALGYISEEDTLVPEALVTPEASIPCETVDSGASGCPFGFLMSERPAGPRSSPKVAESGLVQEERRKRPKGRKRKPKRKPALPKGRAW